MWGTWVAQSVKQPPLDFSLGHKLTVHGFKLGSALTGRSLLGILHTPLAFPPCSQSLKNKIIKKNFLKEKHVEFLDILHPSIFGSYPIQFPLDKTELGGILPTGQ